MLSLLFFQGAKLKIFKFKTSKPGKGHPEGVYLTTKSPEELMKTNNGFKKLGITSSKSEYFFEFEIDESLLKTFKGDRSEFIKFTDDVINIDRSNVLRYGETPKKK